MIRQLMGGLVGFLLFLAPVAAQAADLPVPADEIDLAADTGEEIGPLVFNGDPVPNPGWVTSIISSGFYTCSGSLVHPQWVLTAAHCVDQGSASSFLVLVGADRWFQGTQRSVAQIRIHPDYSGDPASTDLAMLRLETPVNGTPLPSLVGSSSWPLVGQTLRVLGWGETFSMSGPPSLLQGANVSVGSDPAGDIGSSTCNPVWVLESGFDDFCFGGVSWACAGDSGGPVVGRTSPSATSGSFNTIYGITSFGQNAECSDVEVDTMAQGIGRHVSWIRSFLSAGSAGIGDEMFFYRQDGLYRFYAAGNSGELGKPIAAGDDYTTGWSTITGVDLEGDGQDEMFFYRDDGLYRYYNVRPDGSLPAPMQAGTGYTKGWDSITAVDLDGDGQDEMFFYRDDGLFRYYNIRPNGNIGTPILAGTGYTKGWDSITAVDLDGDGQDEMFFYRDDGLFRYYNIRPNGNIGTPILAGTGYTKGWDSITAVDLDGDGQDEMFFYRDDGLFRYYNIRPNGNIGTPILAGTGYTKGWDSITAVDLDG